MSGITPAAATANLKDDSAANIDDFVANYSVDNPSNANGPYPIRPFAYVDEDSHALATARAMLNDEGKVVRVVHGLVPLSGERRGEDVMLTDALGFDLRVYDPGAPLFAHVEHGNGARTDGSGVVASVRSMTTTWMP